MSLGQIFEKYQDKVQFAMIYIREAHPVDGWTFGNGMMAGMVQSYAPHANIEIKDPQTLAERRQVAGDCQETLTYGFMTYVDEIDDRVTTLYSAKPTRLYLIGLDGKVAYAGGAGPLGFKPAQFDDAIKSYLEEQQKSS